jgi:hypothetical protein
MASTGPMRVLGLPAAELGSHRRADGRVSRVRGQHAGRYPAPFILGGLVSVAFGVVLFAHPGVGALTLALLFGLFNLVYGTRALVQGIELRRTRHGLHSAVPERMAARTTAGDQPSSAA